MTTGPTCFGAPSIGLLSKVLPLLLSTLLPLILARRSSSAWKPKAACCTAAGTSTTPASWCAGPHLTARQLKNGYDQAYADFYSWANITKASRVHDTLRHQLKHFAYAGGWKKFEPLWNFVIKFRHLDAMRPLLEAILSKVSGSDTRIERGLAPTPAPAATSEMLLPLPVVH